MRFSFGKILLIIIVSILLALLYNYFSPKGLGLFEYNNKEILAAELLGENYSEPKQIHLNQAVKLYESGVVFLDAREPEEFSIGYIPNAINIYADDFEAYKNRLDKLSKEEPVVTYCGGTDCDLSIVLGNKLSKLGYKKIFVFFGGWNEWNKAKLPVKNHND